MKRPPKRVSNRRDLRRGTELTVAEAALAAAAAQEAANPKPGSKKTGTGNARMIRVQAVLPTAKGTLKKGSAKNVTLPVETTRNAQTGKTTDSTGKVTSAVSPRIIAQDKAVARVQAVYDELAERKYSRNCTLKTECCQFKLTGLIPDMSQGEAILAAKALRLTGRTRLPVRKDGACPMLDPNTSRCIIYEARPFGCRTHFCEGAGGPYGRKEVIDLIHKLNDIELTLGCDEPRPLPLAMQFAIAEYNERPRESR